MELTDVIAIILNTIKDNIIPKENVVETSSGIVAFLGSMSDDLKGAIITAIVTSIISIIGFILTNYNMSKNLKNELKKEKTSVHIQKMTEMPYDVLRMMDKIMQESAGDEALDDYRKVLNTICAYGSSDAIKIASKMQSENYLYAGTDEYDSYRAISFYALLVTQTKYDVTNIIDSPQLWFKLKIRDYNNSEKAFREANNRIVDELKLNEGFRI